MLCIDMLLNCRVFCAHMYLFTLNITAKRTYVRGTQNRVLTSLYIL
jgi:hypothetical protein